MCVCVCVCVCVCMCVCVCVCVCVCACLCINFYVLMWYYLASHLSTSAIKSFFLLGIHVKPSNAFEEINSLHSAFIDVSKHYGTTRGIILGDFNAGCDYLSQKKYKELTLVQDPNFRWLLDPTTNTNVRKTCPYDK